jgi:hypothetical protein
VRPRSGLDGIVVPEVLDGEAAVPVLESAVDSSHPGAARTARRRPAPLACTVHPIRRTGDLLFPLTSSRDSLPEGRTLDDVDAARSIARIDVIRAWRAVRHA